MTELNNQVNKDEDESQKVPGQEDTLGSLLKSAREQKGITIEDAATRLHLRPCIVADIEADCFSNIDSSTYVRGYVKNYARILDVDKEAINACLARQVPKVTEPAMQSFSRKTSRQATDSRLMLVTYLIGFLLLALLVVWWLQKPLWFPMSTFPNRRQKRCSRPESLNRVRHKWNNRMHRSSPLMYCRIMSRAPLRQQTPPWKTRVILRALKQTQTVPGTTPMVLSPASRRQSWSR